MLIVLFEERFKLKKQKTRRKNNQKHKEDKNFNRIYILLKMQSSNSNMKKTLTKFYIP